MGSDWNGVACTAGLAGSKLSHFFQLLINGQRCTYVPNFCMLNAPQQSDKPFSVFLSFTTGPPWCSECFYTHVCAVQRSSFWAFFFFFKPFPSVSNFQAQCKCSYTWKTCVWICTTFHVFLQSLVYPYNVYPFLLQNQWSKMLESDIIQFVESFWVQFYHMYSGDNMHAVTPY